MLCLCASLAWLPLQSAAAQHSSKSPTPQQLWRAYPLDPTVTPGPQPAVASPPARARPERTPVAVSRLHTRGGVSVTVLVLLALFAAGAAVTFVVIRRRRTPEPAAAPALPTPRRVATAPILPPLWRDSSGRFARAPKLSPSVPALAMAESRQDPASGGRERPSPVAGTNPGHHNGSQPTPAAPPDHTRAWTAEIEWHQSDAEGVFRVVARPTEGHGEATIAESALLEWPPKGPASVQGLRQAAEQLEVSLLAAGWQPLPRGSGWYAKRFTWEAAQRAGASASAAPPAPPASAEPAEPPEARQPQRPGRFELGPPWPADTLDLWRCEIRWHAGYVNSSFRALALPPGKRRGRTIGESTTFKWMVMEPPDPRERATLAELRRLASALAEAGWQRVGRGPDWYSERYAWRREGPPPDHLEPAPIEGGRAS